MQTDQLTLQPSMTQYTKFTKNLAYNENYSNLNSSNLKKSYTMHNSPNKAISRGAAHTGSPSLSVNSNLPKPVLITNLNSSNIGNLIKNERIKSSALARSVTMRYNTNTKNQFENGNFANGLIQPAQANQSNQTNHFHYSRNKSSNQAHHSPSTPSGSAQQQLASDLAAQSKKEYLSLLSSIHRSSSIKINRDRSNLSNYFSSLVQNKERGLSNSTANLSQSNSFYHHNPNSNSNGQINQLNHNSPNLKQSFLRKQQPFSLRNNNINNIFGSNNTLGNNTNNETSNSFYNANSNVLSNPSPINHKNKTSISLDNVYNGLESIITTTESNNRYNLNHKYDLNKSNLAINPMTPTNNRKQISTTNSTSHINLHNANPLRSSVTPTNLESETALSRQQRKRFQKMDTTEDEQDDPIVVSKDLPSSRVNQNTQIKVPESNEVEANTNGEIIEIDEEAEQTGIKKIEIINKNDSRLSAYKRMNKNRKSNEEAYETKINKFDIIDQLDAQKAMPAGHIQNKGIKSKSMMHTSSLTKPVSQNSYNSNGQIQKINGNNIQLLSDKHIIDLQSRHNGTNGQSNGRPLGRAHSALSHVTRDINDSYAYTNVHQYIEENDLMPPEKLVTIKKWVKEVNGQFDNWEKKTIEKNIEDLFL